MEGRREEEEDREEKQEGNKIIQTCLEKDTKIQIQRVDRMISKWKNENKNNIGRIKQTPQSFENAFLFKVRMSLYFMYFHTKFVADIISTVCVCVHTCTLIYMRDTSMCFSSVPPDFGKRNIIEILGVS